MTTRIQTQLRYCLTCRCESDRSKFVNQKCGKCIEKYGLPRRSPFKRGGPTTDNKPNKNLGFVK